MLTDEIVEEVRANREAHAAKFNYSLRAIYDNLKKSEARHIQQGYISVEPVDVIAKSGSRRLLTSSPHTTLRADPHRAVHFMEQTETLI
ncbi:MAG: hypothetical protein U9N32_01390 [Spirochaetota bacterium]|nr:hypothetical protein [Spirochaetota bacterium]